MIEIIKSKQKNIRLLNDIVQLNKIPSTAFTVNIKYSNVVIINILKDICNK